LMSVFLVVPSTVRKKYGKDVAGRRWMTPVS
jgi:hypothetical protein